MPASAAHHERIEGGIEEVRKLTAFIRKNYRRRSALMDELENVGW